MRNFYYRLVKNLFMAVVCCFLALSYRLIYNRFYFEFKEDISVSVEDKKKVYPCGKIVGIYTSCNGIFVIDTCEIEGKNGEFIDVASGYVKTGDYITAINGEMVTEKEDLVEAVKESKGKELQLEVKRNEEIFTTRVAPILAKNGEYMLGIWVKDDVAGVGTMTYFTSEGNFAALGHGMGDGETQRLLKIDSGDLYVSNVIGIEKGLKGNPGEIKGVIYYGKANHLGSLKENTKKGVFGNLDTEEIQEYTQLQEPYQVADKQEIQTGAAQIISEVSGSLKTYDIEITYVDYLASDSYKGLHVKVVDNALIELTGGIVQGMSGSPIIQNGKLIGAITHVLINDPMQGYGIFIDEMFKYKKRE